MLFISDQPKHVIVRSATKPLYDTKGRLIQPSARRLFAKFVRGGAPGWAQTIGTETFAMLERPPEVEPGAWLAAYDSEDDDLTAEERAAVETRLLSCEGVLFVEPARLLAPYPMYDKHRKTAGKRTVEHAIADITAAYESAGFDFEHAVAYERENGNDAAVIAALQALGTPETVDAEQVIAA